ncbi:MAG: glucose-1-phosphate adenylyltransferase [Anaerolineales bacterium]|jgi:glucose-1-phosphate adenylyltransferase
MPSTNDILGVIMGGGSGTRLYPLTRDRAKPAVPIAGKYRLIDIPISNCINSGIYRIAVLTQFNSVSLHRHITRTYNFDPFHQGWVQIWAAEQTLHSHTWYQGTADAVRKQLLEIRSARTDYTLILAGDHLYRMDYEEMARYHWEQEADISVAVQPIPRDQAPRFGLLKREHDGTISDFVEKPTDPDVQAQFISRDDPERPYLGSMGIYLFKTDVLVDVLRSTSDDDFGGEVIPKAIHTHKVYGFDFDDYWEDIGTIRSFYDTNLRLAFPNPPFRFHDPKKPIFTHARFLPGTMVEGAKLENVFLADGCNIGRAEITNAVIGLRSQVKEGATVRDTYLMGADYYERPENPPEGGIPIGIGAGAHIAGAIIDKNARIAPGVIVRNYPRGTDIDAEDWAVCDGIVVIPKNTLLPPGTVIGPE